MMSYRSNFSEDAFGVVAVTVCNSDVVGWWVSWRMNVALDVETVEERVEMLGVCFLDVFRVW